MSSIDQHRSRLPLDFARFIGVLQMRRRLVLMLIVGIFLGGLQPLGANALSASHLDPSRSATVRVDDPEDVPACNTAPDCPIDIRFVSIRAYTSGAGLRMLAVRIRAYELYGGLVEIANIKLLFDTRPGSGPDWHVLMSLANLDSSIGWACGRRFGVERFRIEVRENRMTCFIPRRILQPTKPIRLRALSRGNTFVVDRAPDQGWAA